MIYLYWLAFLLPSYAIFHWISYTIVEDHLKVFLWTTGISLAIALFCFGSIKLLDYYGPHNNQQTTTQIEK